MLPTLSVRSNSRLLSFDFKVSITQIAEQAVTHQFLLSSCTSHNHHHVRRMVFQSIADDEDMPTPAEITAVKSFIDGQISATEAAQQCTLRREDVQSAWVLRCRFRGWLVR